MKNYIGIDISKISSGISVESCKGHFLFNYTTHNLNYKWIKRTSDLIKFRHFDYNEVDDYSENEIVRLKIFTKISNQIIKDILNHIDINEKTIIGIEGYSYGKSSGPLIDLIGISTGIRMKILENIPNIEVIKIIAPKKVKTLISELVYGLQKPKLGKKGQPLKEYIPPINKEGIKGGDFEKKDIFKAMLDGNINSPILNYCIENKDEILKTKKLSKPWDDIIDSLFIKEIIK
jgi:hypothetical protein